MKNRRVYEELRNIIEQCGGRMEYDNARVWTVALDGKTGRFESNGAGFPELDGLYIPNVPNPKHSSDYSKQLASDALERFLRMLK